MSRSKTDDDKPTAQLACWIDRDVLAKAKDVAKKRGQRLNAYVDKALAKQLERDQDDDEDSAGDS